MLSCTPHPELSQAAPPATPQASTWRQAWLLPAWMSRSAFPMRQTRFPGARLHVAPHRGRLPGLAPTRQRRRQHLSRRRSDRHRPPPQRPGRLRRSSTARPSGGGHRRRCLRDSGASWAWPLAPAAAQPSRRRRRPHLPASGVSGVAQAPTPAPVSPPVQPPTPPGGQMQRQAQDASWPERVPVRPAAPLAGAHRPVCHRLFPPHVHQRSCRRPLP